MPFVREPAVAGFFYTAEPVFLRKEVEQLLSAANPPKVNGTLRGLISPHAGYSYSGLTAAFGYKLIEKREFDVVIIIGPSHREYFDEISIFQGDSYRTPLGEVKIQSEIRALLCDYHRRIIVSSKGHHLEHSIEVQLPFLQTVLVDFAFVPIVMGDQRRGNCDLLADALATVLKGKKVLIVASSDLSHYYTYDVANNIDSRVLNDVRNFDADALLTKLEHEEAEACGGGPIVVAMKALSQLGCTKTEILHHCNSGDVSFQKDSVVGYLSAAIIQS